jgi:hypothetical protein
MPLPQNQAQQQAYFRQLSQMDPGLRSFVAQQAIKEQKTVLPVPYWSTVQIHGAVAGNVLTVDTTVRKAFTYNIGGDMAAAGFAAGTIAQPCDTNLLRPGETLDNADVYIWGLAIELCPNSEPLLAAELWRQCIVEISTSGTQSIRLGTPGMFPSAGGLYGQGRSAAAQPNTTTAGALDGGQGATVGFVANGNPMGGNFMKFPQPFKWSSVGSNSGDSQLTVSITPNRVITIPLAATRAAVPVVAMVSPAAIEVATQPATEDFGTFCDLRVRLVAVSVGARGQNV